jgi:hypothetical protein
MRDWLSLLVQKTRQHYETSQYYCKAIATTS